MVAMSGLLELIKNRNLKEVGLKSLRESQPKLTSRNGPPKNYCQANIGGKWVEYSPLKRMGGFSTVKVVGKII